MLLKYIHINRRRVKARCYYNLAEREKGGDRDSNSSTIHTSTLLPVPIDCLLRRISSHALKGYSAVNANITSKTAKIYPYISTKVQTIQDWTLSGTKSFMNYFSLWKLQSIGTCTERRLKLASHERHRIIPNKFNIKFANFGLSLLMSKCQPNTTTYIKGLLLKSVHIALCKLGSLLRQELIIYYAQSIMTSIRYWHNGN